MKKPIAATTHTKQVIYHIYYGPSNGEKACMSFDDIDAADKFFKLKQAANLHVEAYKEVVESVRTITKLA